MSDRVGKQVAIVDYGLGNLYSVKQACEQVGLRACITSEKREIVRAAAVILPGVGAFGEAMQALSGLDLVEPLRDLTAAGTPLMGICLGMQLLMSESYEFGCHQGLRLIEGDVVRLEESGQSGRRLKVPQVGWNRVWVTRRHGALATSDEPCLAASLFEHVPDGAFMYFVHSFFCRPVDANCVVTTSRYGAIDFCSTVRRGNVIGFQFHPERSGRQGLQLYRNFHRNIRNLASLLS